MPSLIPVTVNATAGDSLYVSNDPNFANVVLLLHGDGAGTAVVDSSLPPKPLVSTMSQTATTPKFGAACIAKTSTTVPGQTILVPYSPGSLLDILSGTADFTIDGWVWEDSSSGSQWAVCDYGGGQGGFGTPAGLALKIGSSGGAVQLFVVTNLADSVSGQAWKQCNAVITGAALDAWHHVAIVRHGGVPLVFFDGVSQTLTGSSNWTNYARPAVAQTYAGFGYSSADSGSAGTGKIDEFRVTAGVARWTANFTPPTAATIAYPLRRGYSDGSVPAVPAYGSSNPHPAVVDGDYAVIISDLNTGTSTAPVFNFQVAIESTVGGDIFDDDLTSVSFIDQNSTQQNLLASAATFTTPNNGTTGVWTWPVSGELLAYQSTTAFTFVFEDPNQDFNCDCEVVSQYATLSSVRTKMMIRLGYPNQASNPPPGMQLLVDQFLRDAQVEIYRQMQRAALRTERFYRWTMVPGQRYYGLGASEGDCNAQLDPYKITWAGFEDLNRAWYRLDEGIPPEFYTRANINFGWPTRYEIRSCIEIFPAPQAAYTLWIKGDFGLDPLVADSDRFTIDDNMVYLLALGNAKAHYGQKDAQIVLTQAGNMTKHITAGTHGTKRYVPNAGTLSPLTPPRFLPLGNNQA